MSDHSLTGVVLRAANDKYMRYPLPESQNSAPEGLSSCTLELIAVHLKCEVLLMTRCRLYDRVISQLLPSADMMRHDDETNIQIISSLAEIDQIRKGHFACLVREPPSLLVWSDVVTSVVPYAERLEEKMVHTLWDNNTKQPLMLTTVEVTAEVDPSSLEAGEEGIDERRDEIIVSLLICCAIILLAWFVAVNIKKLVVEVRVDHSYIRLALLAYVPFTYLWTSFFAIVITGFVFQAFGPISQMNNNSRFYSAVAPRRITGDLPMITIQCPVYKESLEQVIMPTVNSLKQAISTYQMQGGQAQMFFNDDGMQLLTEEERTERQKFYESNDIAWVARPAHNHDGFHRAGRFKKASNMNYALWMSMMVEDALDAQEDNGQDVDIYAALDAAIEGSAALGPKALAAGDIRMGELVLLVDSDTRVPADCLIDAASEFAQCPQLAILQHASGVMQVVHDFWENGITHFTNGIYFAIRYACASGDASPFVGHNAFLRWSAIQEIAYQNGDGRDKYWSEEHVSEDFEMSLKVQMKGYIVRLAAYSNGEFKEGVSLTVYDELARWQKYAYGCSELVFNPFKAWFRKGPITPIFRTFLRSNMKSFAKFTMLAYIATYYAISAGAGLTLINYFVVGWFSDKIDQFYVQSFDLFLPVIFVFNFAWPIFNAFLRFRVKEAPFWKSLIENYKWGIMMSIFMGGLGIHLTSALLAHLFSIDVNWGSTNKTLENSSFSKEVPKIWKQFKWLYIGLAFLILMMIALAFATPEGWRINGLVPCICLGWLIAAHALLPIALNPQSYLSELHS